MLRYHLEVLVIPFFSMCMVSFLLDTWWTVYNRGCGVEYVRLCGFALLLIWSSVDHSDGIILGGLNLSRWFTPFSSFFAFDRRSSCVVVLVCSCTLGFIENIHNEVGPF